MQKKDYKKVEKKIDRIGNKTLIQQGLQQPKNNIKLRIKQIFSKAYLFDMIISYIYGKLKRLIERLLERSLGCPV